MWVNQPFFGHMLGWTVIIGETVCWTGILLCSDTIHIGEDSIWTIHASMMLYYAQTQVQMVVYGVFVAYMILVHLPRRHSEIPKYLDCKLYRGTRVKIPD